MLYQPLLITAYMASAIAVQHDYSPDLASVLEALWLAERGLLKPAPDPKTIIIPDLPVARHTLNNDWLWAVSSPIYDYRLEQIEQARKRWNAGLEHPIDWSGKRANVQTNGGAFKSQDKAIRLRTTAKISWFAVGNALALQALLNGCTALGHRRGIGHGQVSRWEVKPIAHDYSLVREGRLMQPVPLKLVQALPIVDLTPNHSLHWSVKPPRWHSEFAEPCVMPVGLAKREEAIDWFDAATAFSV